MTNSNVPSVKAGGTYRTYHWLTKRHKDEVCTTHPTYAIAKKNAEYWEERGYHVIVRVPAEHKMYTED